MYTRRTTHHRSNTNPVTHFFRRPQVQIGILLVVGIIIALIALSGSQQPSAASGLPAEINAAQAYQLYQKNGAIFVDVREKSEWDAVHIPNATLIPLGQLPDRLNEIPKDRPVVVVCHSGNRSAAGRDILKQNGYTNVTSMAGGLTSWKTQGFPTLP
jgi:rhodanese-related sulfurtransferase